MSYSVSAPMRGKKLLDEMLTFMDEHYRHYYELFNEHCGKDEIDGPYSRGPLTGDLSYDHGKLNIGFDFNACDPERHYLFCIIAWMAIRSGKRRDIGRFRDDALPKEDLDKCRAAGIGKIPYYLYDGRDATPVCLKGQWEPIVGPVTSEPSRSRYTLTEENGYKHSRIMLRTIEFCPQEQEYYDITRRELDRISELWEAREKVIR